MVVQAIHIVLSIFVMIGVGMWLTHIGWLNDSNSSLISRLVVKVALPGMIISNLFTSFTQESMLQSLPGLIAPFLSILVAMAVSFGVCRLACVPENRRGVFSCMFTFSNSVFIGVPVSLALFGDQAMPYTLMYYIANTVMFWTMGVVQMRRDSGQATEHGSLKAVPEYVRALIRRDQGAAADARYQPARVALAGIRRALPLPLVVFFVCLTLVLMGLKPPASVLSAAKYMGNMVTPLSLFFTGIIITRMLKRGRIRWQRGYSWMLLGRFVITPLIMVGFSLIMPMSELMRNVLIVQSSMPVMSQTSIVAESLNADSEYAAGGTALSTLLSLIAIPLYMAIL